MLNKPILKRLLDSSAPYKGCLIWFRGKDRDGYGKITFQNKSWRAHRLIWTVTKGSIPSGAFICHKCDTPSCIKLSHLFVGTVTENNRDCVDKKRHKESRKKMCVNGHKFSKENTYIWRKHRHCIECRLIRKRKTYG